MIKTEIDNIVEQGGFSEIDIHFAKFLQRLSGNGDPDIFLAAILVSYFTGEGHICLDISSIAGKQVSINGPDVKTLTCPGLSSWREKLEASGVVGKPGDFRPLILDNKSRLYLNRYWQYEKTLADMLKARAETRIEDLDIEMLKIGVRKLFKKSEKNGTDWQKVAAVMAVTSYLTIISGGPGTGKSTLIGIILALIIDQAREKRLRIALTAPTGKAATRLQEAIGNIVEGLPLKESTRKSMDLEASTIHRLLGTVPGSPYFRHNARNPLPLHIVVVDESSMVDLALLTKLLLAVPTQARVILLGDKDQLASVEAGAVMGDICNRGYDTGFSRSFCGKYHEITGDKLANGKSRGSTPPIRDCVVQLKKSYRFGRHSGIAKTSAAINQGDGDLALSILKTREFGDTEWKRLPDQSSIEEAIKEIVFENFKPYIEISDPVEAFKLFENFRILCALRRGPFGVYSLNKAVEKILGTKVITEAGQQWYHGKPLLITKNDYNLGLFNGDIGIVMRDLSSSGELMAFFLTSGGGLRKYHPIRLPPNETAYAMTVHKSQGSEFERALLILPGIYTSLMTRELIYTGITRAKESIEVWGDEGIFTEGVNRKIERTSGLREALWEQ